MPDAYIYDHVRTPRGRGKPDGALHEVTALNLAAMGLGFTLLAIITVYLFVENFQPRLLE